MTRSFHGISCESAILAATLDNAGGSTGLLIVSGGNEIRSGAHAGMARLASYIAAQGFPVLRYDRRGIGESSGENNGFLSTQKDIAVAADAFSTLAPQITKIIAFGNCDAATALALFAPTSIDELILANPWVIETEISQTDEPTSPPASAIRARYWAKLKDPRSFIDLFSGRINLGKLASGLKKAARKETPSSLAIMLRDALYSNKCATRILLAERDNTALAFTAAWSSDAFKEVRAQPNISVRAIKSASHSFADEHSSQWLREQILAALKSN